MVQLNQDFINSIANDLPAELSLDDFIAYCDKPLRPSLRVNTLKISAEVLVTRLTTAGWELSPVPWCHDGFWFTAPNDIQPGNTVEHLQGLFYIQEASSMMPPTALFDQLPMPDAVLDMASAPGSKTTQIAALMNNCGLLVANEYSSSRTKILHANLGRMGVSNTAMTHFDARVFGEYLYETFDAILLDAPCSGEGTIRKDPLALKDWRQSDIDDIAATQRDLIISAFLALKPGGTLVYSTCTLNKRENHQVCHFLKQQYGDAVEFVSLANLFPNADKALSEEGFLHIWPQIYDSEGFFVAKLKKTASVQPLSSTNNKARNFPFTPISHKQFQELKQTIGELLQYNFDQQRLWQRDDEIWLFPEGIAPLLDKMRFQRLGLKVAEVSKHGLKVQQEAISALAYAASAIELTEPQAIEYLMGRDIALAGNEKAQGECLVAWQGVPLGMAKHLGNRLKNQLPRHQVRDKVSSSSSK
ncbi:16S rRNA (cytosine(1407)-C(5))-methyltransferase RsmF [Shewanella avicenniae]|uniref:Ribosomal RNA small subunit methyltransferase F n=1 Tax=Shewanella avicenniae TaxID=2814294 RepID=A0ABX7QMH1_9GAMM|nr:16S rRNA (cytosine(1407)-C(5))-methyltransferase RsmF [Shewanella avicenniae]QSX32171.1 16S rRNA (cytosine(1407)-C(5))-methyltransferase RsmF [Shewanella avicenniae]